MKKMLLSVLVSAITICCSAQSKFAKDDIYIYNHPIYNIDKFDIPEEVMNLDKCDPAAFWTQRIKYDSRLRRLHDRIHSDSKSARIGLQQIRQIKNFEDDVLRKEVPLLKDVRPELEATLDSVFHFADIDPRIALYYYANDEVNASTCPNGTILINKGLIDNFSTDEIIFTVAHELTHFTNEHKLRQLYKDKVKEKQNKMWANIGTGFNIFAAGVIAYNDIDLADYGVKVDGKKTAENVTNILASTETYRKDAAEATLRFHFRYSREEEIESDITAFRFLQWIGIDTKAAISVTDKFIELDDAKQTEVFDSHPSGVMRKQILLELQKENEK